MNQSEMDNNRLLLAIENLKREKVFTVLVIDDDKMIQSIFKKLLESLGFAVIATANPFEGISWAISKNPCLIILDVYLPDLDGEKILKIFKSIPITENIPIVIVSGNMNLDLLNSTYSQGASAFLSKPFTPEDLAGCVNRALGLERFNENEEITDKNTNEM